MLRSHYNKYLIPCTHYEFITYYYTVGSYEGCYFEDYDEICFLEQVKMHMIFFFEIISEGFWLLIIMHTRHENRGAQRRLYYFIFTFIRKLRFTTVLKTFNFLTCRYWCSPVHIHVQTISDLDRKVVFVLRRSDQHVAITILIRTSTALAIVCVRSCRDGALRAAHCRSDPHIMTRRPTPPLIVKRRGFEGFGKWKFREA